MDEKILNKIRNLLKLSESPEVHEASLAMAMARKLMLKYNIEEGQLSVNDTGVHIEDLFGEMSKRSIWETVMTNQISAIFSSVLLVHKVSKTRYRFKIYGHKDDIEMIKCMYSFSIATIERLFKNHLHESGRSFSTQHELKVYRESYKYGVADALITNMKQKYSPTVQENALILCRKAKVDNYIDENIKTKQSKIRNTKFDAQGYMHGHRDGKNVSVNKNIANGNNERESLVA